MNQQRQHPTGTNQQRPVNASTKQQQRVAATINNVGQSTKTRLQWTKLPIVVGKLVLLIALIFHSYVAGKFCYKLATGDVGSAFALMNPFGGSLSSLFSISSIFRKLNPVMPSEGLFESLFKLYFILCFVDFFVKFPFKMFPATWVIPGNPVSAVKFLTKIYWDLSRWYCQSFPHLLSYPFLSHLPMACKTSKNIRLWDFLSTRLLRHRYHTSHRFFCWRQSVTFHTTLERRAVQYYIYCGWVCIFFNVLPWPGGVSVFSTCVFTLFLGSVFGSKGQGRRSAQWSRLLSSPNFTLCAVSWSMRLCRRLCWCTSSWTRWKAFEQEFFFLD